jgi:hypothetical protein
MSKGSEDKCISPWFGFAVILLVCVIVTSAVFFEFGNARHKKVSRSAKVRNAAKVRIQRVAAPVDQGAGMVF